MQKILLIFSLVINMDYILCLVSAIGISVELLQCTRTDTGLCQILSYSQLCLTSDYYTTLEAAEDGYHGRMHNLPISLSHDYGGYHPDLTVSGRRRAA